MPNAGGKSLPCRQLSSWHLQTCESGWLTHPAWTSPCVRSDLHAGWAWDESVSGMWVILTAEEISWSLKRVAVRVHFHRIWKSWFSFPETWPIIFRVSRTWILRAVYRHVNSSEMMQDRGEPSVLIHKTGELSKEGSLHRDPWWVQMIQKKVQVHLAALSKKVDSPVSRFTSLWFYSSHYLREVEERKQQKEHLEILWHWVVAGYHLTERLAGKKWEIIFL